MTTLVSLEHKEFNPNTNQMEFVTYLAADSKTSYGWLGATGASSKINLLHQHIAIAACGSARLNELFTHGELKEIQNFCPDNFRIEVDGKLVPFKQASRADKAYAVRNYITNHLTPAIKKMFKKYESVKEDKSTYPIDGGAIVSMCGFNFDIDRNYYSGRKVLPFVTDGSGWRDARGSLMRGITLADKFDPVTECLLAVKSAILSDNYSGAPIHLVKMSESKGFISHDVYREDLSKMSDKEAKEHGARKGDISVSYAPGSVNTSTNIYVPTKEDIRLVLSTKNIPFPSIQIWEHFSKNCEQNNF